MVDAIYYSLYRTSTPGWLLDAYHLRSGRTRTITGVPSWNACFSRLTVGDVPRRACPLVAKTRTGGRPELGPSTRLPARHDNLESMQRGLRSSQRKKGSPCDIKN